MPKPLLPLTRQKQILAQLQQHGAVRVAALAAEMEVAEETIRRDLDHLDHAGDLKRTHGGAVIVAKEHEEPSLEVRRETNAQAKTEIAKIGLEMLRARGFFETEDRVLGFDASSTALALARLLPDQPMTVVTNGLETMQLLSQRAKVRVIATGGEYDRHGACYIGPLAEATLRQLAIDVACLSCRAVDPVRGLSEASPTHASFKRALLDSSESSMLLFDESKLGQKAVSLFAPLDSIDLIATDAPL